MGRPLLTLIAFAACALHAAVVIDRIAVVVDRHVINASDIDRDVRITEFLNRQPLKLDAAEKKKAAERLIDQELIRVELSEGGYDRATDSDADNMFNQIRRERYGNSDVRLRQALAAYGVTENQLRSELLWQLTVLRFIDERFRTGVLVTDEDVTNYYNQHRAQFHAALAGVSATIRNSLEGEQINRQFDDWLAEVRQRAHIAYKNEAFQ